MSKISWLLYLNLVVIQAIDVQKTSGGICKAHGYEIVIARFGKETHTLCLKWKLIDQSLTSEQSVLLLDPDASLKTPDKHYRLSEITMAYGFPVEDPESGSAEGYIGEDNQFYGVLHIGNRTLHADPYGRDDPNKQFGAYENDFMQAPRSVRSESQYDSSFSHLMQFRYKVKEKKTGVAQARICELLLLADKEFYEKDANSSLKHVIRRMMHAVAQADIIFRNADFNEDGIPDNIGFSVKYILVLTSDETNTQVFGDLLRNRSIDGRAYLMHFARLRRLSEVCLGVAFSGHAFHNRTLGLSFTSLGGGMGGAAGGLCDRRASGRSFNTLALAHGTSDENERVPERVAASTLAHEMGHSFGAHHDDNFPNPECKGYLMGSQSSTTQTAHTLEFSLCSKRLIAATLSSMSYCLAVTERPYCGNGIVEKGEACDCGLPFYCKTRDPCCTPRAGGTLASDALHKEGCSVAPRANCHPSQGLCCNADCHYANFTKSGIDCTRQTETCTCPDLKNCRCGLGGRCLPDGTCQAAECAVLGLRECTCKGTPGGTLGKMKMCGVCCRIAYGSALWCVGAETAAKYAFELNLLPDNWPDPEYIGPNVTVKLGNTTLWTYATIRAWPPGDVCVIKNTVGMCSPRGVCKSVKMLPSSNIYPDILTVKILRQSSSQGIKLKPRATLTTLFISLNIFNYKY
ncbi:unnamed protein product [Pieris macdunnoughi]|uniref:Uncharacterized protein n=1 Tax=Pieris macdunnoughi TaxID=345717 RepID=A0A821TCQ4_9NEOP|nr:unnamed protein product [Pieris macdunnoughi]